MFITDAMEAALEAKFPKFIYLQEVRVKAPKPFYRVWETDGPGHAQGEFVTRPNREDPDNPIMIVLSKLLLELCLMVHPQEVKMRRN